MFKKIEAMLEKNTLLCRMLMGITLCLGIVLSIVSVVLGFGIFTDSAWLAIPFVLCVIACGACFGIFAYLFDVY